MLKDNKIYMIIYYIVMAIEFVLSIPLVSDYTYRNDGQVFILGLVLVHILLLSFSKTTRAEYAVKGTHYLGIIAGIFSGLPVIAFIFHLVVAVSLAIRLPKLNKRAEKDSYIRQKKVDRTELSDMDFYDKYDEYKDQYDLNT